MNVSSIIGLRAGGGPPTHPYAASKGGMIGLSNSMAVHYGRDNVRVNCIAPGQIHTPMASREVTEEFADLRRRAGPLGIEGSAWDVAYAALFLASDESRWVSRSHAASGTPVFWPLHRWPCSRTCGTRSRVLLIVGGKQ